MLAQGLGLGFGSSGVWSLGFQLRLIESWVGFWFLGLDPEPSKFWAPRLFCLLVF